jgi:CubicO group peptidase (beta-lactamase class C family)
MAFLTDSRGNEVLARASLEEMWQPLVPVGAPGGPASMGLSFFTEKGERATTLVGHTGTQAGFLSFFYLNPATSTAIVAVFNTNDETRPEAESGFESVRRAAMALLR